MDCCWGRDDDLLGLQSDIPPGQPVAHAASALSPVVHRWRIELAPCSSSRRPEPVECGYWAVRPVASARAQQGRQPARRGGAACSLPSTSRAFSRACTHCWTAGQWLRAARQRSKWLCQGHALAPEALPNVCEPQQEGSSPARRPSHYIRLEDKWGHEEPKLECVFVRER